MGVLFIIGCVVMAIVMVINYRLHANGTYTRWSIEQHGGGSMPLNNEQEKS